MAETRDTFVKKFNERIKTVLRPGITPDEMMEEFDDWSTNYEKDMLGEGYVGHATMASVMAGYYPGEGRAQVKILDIGAGTGLVAEEMRKVGFANIDALDPNNSMLEKARLKGLYVNYFKEFFTVEPTSIAKDTYDCLTATSCFVNEHIPTEALCETARIVKPGGLVFIGTRKYDDEYFQSLDKIADELEQQGTWEKVARITTPLHYKGLEGLVRIYRVLK